MADEKMNKFEDNLAELEALVKKLESDIPLDEALSAFQKGIELTRLCISELKSEKGKLQLLVGDLDKITEEFSVDK